MKRPPEGWPRITAAVFYDDAAKAIDWLCAAFGFEVRLKVEGEGGRIEHSELTFGEGVIMVGSTGGKSERPRPLPCKSPRALGGANTQRLFVWVDAIDEHCQMARTGLLQLRRKPFKQLRDWVDEIENFWTDQLRAFKAHAERAPKRRRI